MTEMPRPPEAQQRPTFRAAGDSYSRLLTKLQALLPAGLRRGLSRAVASLLEADLGPNRAAEFAETLTGEAPRWLTTPEAGLALEHLGILPRRRLLYRLGDRCRSRQISFYMDRRGRWDACPLPGTVVQIRVRRTKAGARFRIIPMENFCPENDTGDLDK
jgi:hypothetical protein